ncbi:MAG: hypothetical protein KDD92_13850 [Caldilineaceae bacterium]|nr:hypothetical protein [Caldilineaceae bacterium]
MERRAVPLLVWIVLLGLGLLAGGRAKVVQSQAGGAYQLTVILGQPEAGEQQGGAYALDSGYYGIVPEAGATAQDIYLPFVYR